MSHTPQYARNCLKVTDNHWEQLNGRCFIEIFAAEMEDEEGRGILIQIMK